MQTSGPHIYYPSAQYDDALSFYRDVVGFTMLHQYTRPDGRRGVVFEPHPTSTLEFFEANHDTARIEQGGFRVEVPDLDGLFMRLAPVPHAEPTPIRTVDWGERLFNITAPDGMIVQFYSVIAAQPAKTIPMQSQSSGSALAS